MNLSEKWELYEIRDIPTGKKRRFMCFIHIGLFRKLEKNPQTLTYEYIYKEKQLRPDDYQKFMNSRKRFEHWKQELSLAEDRVKHTQKEFNKLETFFKHTKQFIGLKYMTDWKPPKTRSRRQKFSGLKIL